MAKIPNEVMNHFLEISQLSRPQIDNLFERAFYFKKGGPFPNYNNHYLANLFYEDSTRTRISFELAAMRLGIPVINVDLKNSSENKGEVIEDSIANLAAMGIDLFVIRHKKEGIQAQLASLNEGIHIINAGDGQHAHPSQAMLDLMTIIEKKPRLETLKIAIVGNIRHSRVANSLQCLCRILGVGELVFIAPKPWQPEQPKFGRVTDSLADGLANADVVVCLRVQHERFEEHEQLDLASYRRDFSLTTTTLKFAKPDVMIMHPGPINRGVEIESEVADGARSFILEQVSNGVFMRMAIIEALIR